MSNKRSDAEIQKELARVPLFAGLSKRELKQVAKHSKERSFRAGQNLATQGDGDGALFIILTGTVEVLINDEHRRYLTTGHAVGEMSMIDRQPRSATLRAENDVEALMLSSLTFLNLLEETPSVALGVISNLAKRLRESEARNA